MLGQGAQVPSTEVQRFVQSALSMANFLKYVVPGLRTRSIFIRVRVQPILASPSSSSSSVI